MYIKYIGEESDYFTKDKVYFAEWMFDELTCVDDTESNHILMENEYDEIWFNKNFIKLDPIKVPSGKKIISKDELFGKKEDIPTTEIRHHHYIGYGEYQVVYKKSELSLKSNEFIGICENFNPSGLCAFWNKGNEKMLLVDYKNILGLYPIE